MAPLRVLLIDNRDSYTYNLFQQIAVVNGGTPGRSCLLVRRKSCAERGTCSTDRSAAPRSGPGRRAQRRL